MSLQRSLRASKWGTEGARCPFLLTLSMEDQEGMAQWGQQCMRTLSLFRRES